MSTGSLLARLKQVEARLGAPLEPLTVTLVIVDVGGEVVKEIPFRMGAGPQIGADEGR
jgi:hypothetical protein